MQDRRKMLSYIELEDIPSSATEITSNNYTTVSGNILYAPINGMTYNSPSGNSMRITGSTNVISINDFFIFDTPISRLSSNNYMEIMLASAYSNNGKNGYSNMRIGPSTASGITIPFGIISSSQVSLNKVGFHYYGEDEGTIYYVKVKFNGAINISVLPNSLSSYPPIYIDNE